MEREEDYLWVVAVSTCAREMMAVKVLAQIQSSATVITIGATEVGEATRRHGVRPTWTG